MADPCHITSGQLKVRMLTSINIQWITEPRYLQKINFKKKSQSYSSELLVTQSETQYEYSILLYERQK